MKYIINIIFNLIYRIVVNWRVIKYRLIGRFNAHLYKRAFNKCGNNLSINGNPIIQSPELIEVGDNFTINNNAQLCPHAKIVIGNNVTMSRGSQITSGGLDTSQWRNKRLKEPIDHIKEDVYIADGTWLCVNAIVLSGVKITGKGVIVAAGAVVTNNISEDYVVVAGIPARIVKHF